MNAALFGAERKWTRNLTTTVAGGRSDHQFDYYSRAFFDKRCRKCAVSYRCALHQRVGYSRAPTGAGYLIGARSIH